MSRATPATLALDRAGVAYTLAEYDYDPGSERVGLQAAAALGVAPGEVLKTLMVRVDGMPACVVLASDREVSMKKLAADRGVVLSAQASLHHPYVFNSYRVRELRAYLCRSDKERKALGRFFGEAHAAIEVEVEAQESVQPLARVARALGCRDQHVETLDAGQEAGDREVFFFLEVIGDGGGDEIDARGHIRQCHALHAAPVQDAGGGGDDGFLLPRKAVGGNGRRGLGVHGFNLQKPAEPG